MKEHPSENLTVFHSDKISDPPPPFGEEENLYHLVDSSGTCTESDISYPLHDNYVF